ncbi:hypothetical protein MMC24_000911 [Lignoscripta atroalba]|nr:hypothetical protein [Lignoscripta atroalba]
MMWDALFTDYNIVLDEEGNLSSDSKHCAIAIIYTCKLVHSETFPILYRRSTFWFHGPRALVEFRNHLTAMQAQKIEAIGITDDHEVAVNYPVKNLSRTRRLDTIRRTFPNIKRITSKMPHSKILWPVILHPLVLEDMDFVRFTGLQSIGNLQKLYARMLRGARWDQSAVDCIPPISFGGTLSVDFYMKKYREGDTWMCLQVEFRSFTASN